MAPPSRAAAVAVLLLLLASVPLPTSLGQPVRQGDWTITGEERITGVQVVDGNVTVAPGGRLVVDGGTLRVRSDHPLEHLVRVEEAGTLVLRNGATLEALDALQPFRFRVKGTLHAVGTPDAPVLIRHAGGRAPEGGIFVEPRADGVTLRHAIVRDTQGRGLLLGSGTPVEVEHVSFVATGNVGLELAAHLEGRVTDVHVAGVQRGLEVRGNQRGLEVTGLDVQAEGTGLVAFDAKRLTVEDSTFQGGVRGVVARLGSNVTILDSSFEGYEEDGIIVMEDARARLQGNVLDGGGEGRYGLRVTQSPGVTVVGNVVQGHRQHGLECLAADALFRNNTLEANDGWGIHLFGCAPRFDGNLFGTGDRANGRGRVLLDTMTRVGVVDGEQRPLEGAEVTVRNAAGDVVNRGTTDATGYVPWTNVTVYRDVAGDGVSRNPFTFTATRGELTTRASFALQKPREVVLLLASKPDLTVSSLRVQPPAPEAGSTATVRATVANAGGLPTGPTNVELLVDERRHGPLEVPPLDPGATHSVTLRWNATPGHHVILAHVDPQDAVDEADETNNVRAHSFRVASPPDDGDPDGNGTDGNGSGEGPKPANLVVLRPPLLTRSAGLREGETVTLVATVTNLGETPGYGFDVEVRDNGIAILRERITVLNPGELHTLQARLTLPAGNRTLEVHVDPRGVVPETNRSDNRATLRVEVLAVEPTPVLPPQGPGEDPRWIPGLGAAAAAALALAAYRRRRR